MTEDTANALYSFDYAQQVHFPNNPQLPGPAYFLTARKCQLFRANDPCSLSTLDPLCCHVLKAQKAAQRV